MAAQSKKLVTLSTFLVLQFFSISCFGFYNWQGHGSSLEINGFLQGFGTAYRNPEDTFFYNEKTVSDLGGLGRLLVNGYSGGSLDIELNLIQTYIPSTLVAGQSTFGTTLDVERSGLLEHSFSDDEFVHLIVDRLNVRWSSQDMDITVGRQPINLATTFYFTPNDFFAPFSAINYFRVYKPGVDAMRANYRLGALSQLSLIGVLGYELDPSSDNGWSDSADGDRSAYLGRVSSVLQDTEWVVLGGQVQELDVVGGSVQGELFQWLGLRAEGHIASATPTQERTSNWVLGVEHRWPNSLDARLEVFYHSDGANAVDSYNPTSLALATGTNYLARTYVALGFTYEFTPLLTGNIVEIVNLIDHSSLLSINTVYSLSDESELAISVGLPMGEKPNGPVILSEFGTYPDFINIEARIYF